MDLPEMLGGARKVFLGSLARDTQLIGDLLDRVAGDSVQHQCCTHSRRQLRESPLQLFNTLSVVTPDGRVLSIRTRELGCRVRDVHERGIRRSAQVVLVEHVSRNREEVRLGISDALVLSYSQQPEKDLLGEVGGLMDIAQADRQKAPKSLTVLGRYGSNEGLFSRVGQDWVPKTAATQYFKSAHARKVGVARSPGILRVACMPYRVRQELPCTAPRPRVAADSRDHQPLVGTVSPTLRNCAQVTDCGPKRFVLAQ